MLLLNNYEKWANNISWFNVDETGWNSDNLITHIIDSRVLMQHLGDDVPMYVATEQQAVQKRIPDLLLWPR